MGKYDVSHSFIVSYVEICESSAASSMQHASIDALEEEGHVVSRID